MQLKLIVRTVDDIVSRRLQGRIIFGEESADLRDTVRMVISQSKRVILNLSGVTYIDSGGLGTLVALYTTARNNGGSIKLANLTQRVGDLLQVTKLVTIFDVHDSEEKALESYPQGRSSVMLVWRGRPRPRVSGRCRRARLRRKPDFGWRSASSAAITAWK